MLAFPLLELGRMADAEKAARKGLEINKEDPWVHHAVSKCSSGIFRSYMHNLIQIIRFTSYGAHLHLASIL